MKCFKCGAELSEDAKFCSYCGAKIEAQSEIPPIPSEVEDADKPEVEEKYIYQNNTGNNTSVASKSASNSDKIKNKFIGIWNRSCKFDKIAAIGIALFAILGLSAFFTGRFLSGIFAVIQIAIVAVAILMKKQIIKVSKTWLPLAAIILSFMLIVPYFSLFKVNMVDYEKYAWNDVVLSNMLPKPESPYGEIISNSEDDLSLDVTKTNEEQYGKYIEACKNKGFTIDAEVEGSFFYAYNDKGFKLSLSYYDSEMNISLNAPMELGTLIWPDSEIAKLLPVPKSTIGNIQQDDEKGFAAYIGETTIEEYNSYVKACKDKGFTVDANTAEKLYSAKNIDAYKLSVEYKGNNVIYVSVDEPEFDVSIEIECVENLIFSMYDVDVYIDDEFEGTIPHGDKETYPVVLTKGKHIISFESTEDDTLDGDVEVEILKNETLKFKISCSSFGIDVETVAGVTAVEKHDESEPEESTTKETKITMTNDSDYYAGKQRTDVEKEFKNMGFTNVIIHEVKTTDSSNPDGEVTYVSASNDSFNKGDKFIKDTEIIIYCWKYEKPNSEYEKAFVSAAKDYSIYYMFDVDNKTVVTFCTSDTYVDEGTYSGSFSSGVTITWSHGEWTEKFTNKDGSSYATMIDGNGFAWEYEVCDIMEAQEILNDLH